MLKLKRTTEEMREKGGVAVSKRSEACKIDKSVKDAVFARDGGCCVWCGRSGAYVLPEAHFVPRSKGGKGIEENVLTLCRYTCHEQFDHGDRNERVNMREHFREYLKSKYPDWDETKLYYHK